MYQFFTDSGNICGKDIYITGQDVNHIKNVLRMRIGEEVSVVTQTEDKEYRCEIEAFEEDRVHLKLRFVKEENVELPNRIYLFQGLAKSDKLELIIQKAVELGVYEIIPVKMKRCVVKYDGKKEEAKVLRYNAISEAAAKQSKRRIIPRVSPVMTFGEAIKYCEAMDIKLLPYELADMKAMDKTREILKNIEKGSSIAVFIGPEGGFDDTEVDKAVEAGFEVITLGRRILRTETAGMTVLSWLVFLLET
ncbi:MAG: 16S rRNA (uracil(1498)-N(3))-methyltransferase [Lachnospiraceae bacterium]|nr:16S rRNA (uracil(1498)-N(3))-methyltransferase [Lachnospiraceae bacterium]